MNINKEVSSIWLWSLFFIVVGGMTILVISVPDSNNALESQKEVPSSTQQDDSEVIEQESAEQEEIVNQMETADQDDPAPAQVEKTDSGSTSPASNETASQSNAVRSAKSYLDYTAFSHDGLVEQLEYDQYSHADAVYGADNSGANWYEQATKSAEQYMEYSAFSRGGLIDQLKYDGYTQTQEEHGADAVGL